MGPDPVFAGPFRQRASQIRLPGSGEALEHDVLLAGDELAGAQMGQQAAVQPSFLKQVDPAQVSVRVTQTGASDQAGDLGVGERRVGLIDSHPEPVLERQPGRDHWVLGVDRSQQVGGVHLTQLAFGLDVQQRGAHRVPPA